MSTLTNEDMDAAIEALAQSFNNGEDPVAWTQCGARWGTCPEGGQHECGKPMDHSARHMCGRGGCNASF